MEEPKKKPLQWHPAFYAGLQIELAEDAENLIFENEHQLGTKPKQIDVLIIQYHRIQKSGRLSEFGRFLQNNWICLFL